MATDSKTYDVFISHAASDAKLAKDVAETCRAQGLDAVTSAEMLSASDADDALWEALAESRALLVILSPAGPPPSMSIELGAAQAWNKPIFGILTDPSLNRLPPGWSGINLYPPNRIEDVIRAIKVGGQEFTDDDRSLLAKLYGGIGVSVDQLALDPIHLKELVNRFNDKTDKTVSGERLLSELLRMRKQGRLVSGHLSERAKPRRGSA